MILSAAFLLVSALTASGNIAGMVAAYRRHKAGLKGGFSSVPLLSAILAVASWLCGRDHFGLWIFVPTIFDPGTWSVPVALVAAAWRSKLS
jgi:hypothetical protein